MFRTTTITLRMSRRKSKTIKPVKPAPKAPSTPTLSMARWTIGDSSNWYSILISSGKAAWNRAMFALTSLTTVRVEASARFTTGM